MLVSLHVVVDLLVGWGPIVKLRVTTHELLVTSKEDFNTRTQSEYSKEFQQFHYIVLLVQGLHKNTLIFGFLKNKSILFLKE